MEPLLGGVNLDPPVCPDCFGLEASRAEDGTPFCPECGTEMGYGAILDPLNGGVSWVIVGGESGPGARPFHCEWARTLLAQCREAGAAYFLKRAGVAGVRQARAPILRDRKGGDLSELPRELRVREFPRAA